MFARDITTVPARLVSAPMLVLCVLLAGCGGGTGSGVDAPSTQTTAATPVPTGWAPIGPAPPAVQAPVAIDPASRRIYVASFGGGIFVNDPSSPSGSTATTLNTGLKSLAVNALALAPSAPSTLYAAVFNGGIYKSTDAGKTWGITGETGNIMLYLAVDPKNANTIYAGYNGAVYSLRKSTDGGQTWATASTGIPTGTPVFQIVVDPRNPQTVYAATTGNGAFRSTDGGATWTVMSIEPVIWALAIDPADSSLLYAGTNGNGVYRSADSGRTWKRMGTPSLGVVHALIKVGNRLIAGTASEGVYISDDEGATWQKGEDVRVNGDIAGNSAPSEGEFGMVLSLAADDSGTVYAGTSRQGVWISRDRGQHWDTDGVNNILVQCECQNGYAIAVSPDVRRTLYYSTNDGGLISRDYSSHYGIAGYDAVEWHAARPTMTARAPRSLVFNPVRSDSMYVGSFAGSGFFKSEDGGLTWQRRLFGPPTLHVTNVAVTPDGATLFLVTLGGAGVWTSTDGGDTFQRIDVAVAGGPFLNLAGRGIAVDSAGGPNVYVAGPGGVWRSRDRGATWARVSTVSSLTVQVHPIDPSIVLVGTLSSGVLKSTDSGTTFTAANSGLTELHMGRAGGVLVHRLKPNTYYANTEGGGIFKSRDAGATWTAVNDRLGDLNVFGMAIDPADPDTVYAATQNSVFMTRTGGE